MKKKLKSIAGSALVASRLYPRVFGDHALIAAFHRIDDRYPRDAISFTVDGFRRFCVFFKKHFDVVTLDELLDDLEQDRPIRGKIAITFDDGYLDNYTSAAPILTELGLPATFFIATGFIGTDRVPWWDERVGIRSEWMSWNQVCELARGGFSIGAHTINHVDLSVVHGEDARREIQGSRLELQARLGRPIDLFAYPYGRIDQLSEANREVIKELGFRCAPSCCGGRVSPGDDPHRINRVPISPWFDYVGQFALEMLTQ